MKERYNTLKVFKEKYNLRGILFADTAIMFRTEGEINQWLKSLPEENNPS